MTDSIHTQGAPFETFDEGKARRLTHWEQIDAGEMDTGTRKFLTLAPIVLFILASYYSEYHTVHFIINALSLALGIIPKVHLLFELKCHYYLDGFDDLMVCI